MSDDDPSLDFIASQKSKSDHRAELGHNQGPPLSSFDHESVGSSGSNGGGNGFIDFAFEVIRWLFDNGISATWEIIKGLYAIFSRRR